MKILIAEDDAFFRRLLQQVLSPEHDLVLAEDGGQAWRMLQQPDRPPIALMDWVMPVLSGPQICRKAREHPQLASMYLILLTAKNSTPDIVSGLRAGADDYVTKPFVPEELRARLRIAERLIRLEWENQHRAEQLRQATVRAQRMERLLPICPRCGKIRSSGAYWEEVNAFARDRRELQEMSACPSCAPGVQISEQTTECSEPLSPIHQQSKAAKVPIH